MKISPMGLPAHSDLFGIMEPLPGWGSSPWRQATTANTFGLVLCVFLLNVLRCISVQPLCRDEEYSVGDECCPKCNPGYHVKHACRARTGTVCAPCPPQTYTAHANGLSECLSCGVCDPDMGLLTWRECSSREDTVCRCSAGHFCKTQEGDHCSTCLPHTACPPGLRVLERGNHSQDTVCAECLPGTFSPGGTQEECLPWTNAQCSAWFQVEAEHGTNSTDVTCSSWPLYLLFIFLGLIIVSAIVCMYIRRKATHTSEQHPSCQGSGHQEGPQGSLQEPVARELEPLQGQKQENTVKFPVTEEGFMPTFCLEELQEVLCVFLLNVLRCISVQPLCRDEEYSVGDECCPKCNPGYHVKHACRAWTGAVCAPCPPQTYTAHANGLSEYLSCGASDPGLIFLILHTQHGKPSICIRGFLPTGKRMKKEKVAIQPHFRSLMTHKAVYGVKVLRVITARTLCVLSACQGPSHLEGLRRNVCPGPSM
ncbi:tumor necrosis factor receptor superfamily member 14 isoform X1 [Sigmodon hispidus]